MRFGKFLLGALFWLQVVRLVFQLPAFSIALAHRLLPDWDLHGFSIYVPLDKYALVGDGFLWFATAAIGWFFVLKNRWLRASLALMLVCGAFEILVATTSLGTATLPSDSLLAESFHQNEPDFYRLAAMATEDSQVESIRFDSLDLGDASALPRDREDGYRVLFSKLNVKGLTRPRGLEIEFFLPVAEEREINRIVVKGYAYSLREPSPIVDSLDGVSPKNQMPIFKKLEENWYLYYLWVNY